MSSSWVGDATEAFEAALVALVGERPPDADPVLAGHTAALEAVAGVMWHDEIGPFYDTDGVRQLLGGVSKQAVADRVRRHRLLALRTGSGRLVYPTSQFDGRSVRPGLADVLGLVAPDDTEAWYVASWLTTPDPRLGGREPMAALADGDTDTVLAAARDVAARLRG